MPLCLDPSKYHISFHSFMHLPAYLYALMVYGASTLTFYLYLFLLLFAVFVRCTVAVCRLVLSVTYSISESLKLVLLEIETHRSEGEMKKIRLPVGWFVGTIAGELSHGGQK